MPTRYETATYNTSFPIIVNHTFGPHQKRMANPSLFSISPILLLSVSKAMSAVSLGIDLLLVQQIVVVHWQEAQCLAEGQEEGTLNRTCSLAW